MLSRAGFVAPMAAGEARALAAKDALRAAGLVLVAATAYAGLCAGFWRTAARGPDAFVVVPQAVDPLRSPEWLPPAEIARINSLGAAVKGRSILDPDLAADLAACYLESPWVARVAHIRRAYPNRLDVELVVRRPLAAVVCATGPAAVLDRSGVRLPVSASPEGLVKITGVSSPPPRPGKPWEDVRVADALRVLERYGTLFSEASPGGSRPSDKFAPVEVRAGTWSRPSARPSIEITTRGGVLVVWGVDLPSGEGTVTGPSAEEKLARLAELLPRVEREERPVASVSVSERTGAVIAYRNEERLSPAIRPGGPR